ncbi:4Fe-4S ferredoxin [Sulfodiicoccus acidiphilus]|uniref:4Fe-4S ferredoxin n=1 Tax=Sulfodiicoccus acidiphilus TaxID=1670455 RepID=A0A348B6P8_9CREN|nr:4Fe-4S binding protein [Sulfodiicoccus acidiphilus]BBD73850.1 4Fe-4S ferredoxin [Sulfodiicoccus acidiphilus]GGT96330.1 4Fe-4S ferredoxin [Sulfodiicoccus acidiphilus]
MLEQLALAASMAAFSCYLIWEVKRGYRLDVALYLAGMMIAMNLGAYLYLLNPQWVTYVLLGNSAYMFFGLAPIIYGRRIKYSKASVATFVVLMNAAELSMGALFFTWTTGQPSTLLNAVENYWYIGSMAVEMAFSLTLVESTQLRRYLLFLLPISVVSPVAFVRSREFVELTIWSSTVLMLLATVVVYETLYKERLRATQDTMTTLEVMTIFTAMMVGEFYYYLTSSWIIYDASMMTSMVWFVYRSIVGPNGKRTNYTRDGRWTFTFILLTFVMEWFMGGVLDFASGVLQPGLAGFTNSLALGWVPSLWGVPLDFLSLVSTVTGSQWFLIMMGTEMGLLAAFRLKELKRLENKVRVSLMIAAYAIYTIFLPYFSPISSRLAFIPYMWSMGLGTLGPVTKDYLFGIVGTYAVSALLSFLFGSRQICSVTCTAPLMYQGTFYESLKTFNRTSRLGKKTLGSRLRPWFKWVASVVWVTLLVAALMSFLNQAGVIDFTVAGTDITVFLYSFYFNFLWYVVFVSIPFFGTYACATQGWCSWGTFNQLVGRVGLFRLRVRDPQQCITCESKACAKACPVGNTDMAGHFIREGRFRSMRCVGVGDCVEACPYDNILFYDARHWIKEKISRWFR